MVQDFGSVALKFDRWIDLSRMYVHWTGADVAKLKREAEVVLPLGRLPGLFAHRQSAWTTTLALSLNWRSSLNDVTLMSRTMSTKTTDFYGVVHKCHYGGGGHEFCDDSIRALSNKTLD